MCVYMHAWGYIGFSGDGRPRQAIGLRSVHNYIMPINTIGSYSLARSMLPGPQDDAANPKH